MMIRKKVISLRFKLEFCIHFYKFIIYFVNYKIYTAYDPVCMPARYGKFIQDKLKKRMTKQSR